VSQRRAHFPRAIGRTTRVVGPNVVLRGGRLGRTGEECAAISPADVADKGALHG
jgi:hypothetical protein